MGLIQSAVKIAQEQSADLKPRKRERVARINQSLQELHRLADDRELVMLRFLLSMAVEEVGAVSATLKERGRK
jgi:acyl carrier protein phosphodiesterase